MRKINAEALPDNNGKENKMGTMPVNRLLVSMSLPMIISMIVQALSSRRLAII